MTINILPDVALLRIFDFHLARAVRINRWQTLVHVCRNWRYIVFQSPRRLDLRLDCTCTTLVREKLDVWPPLPIAVSCGVYDRGENITNILAALEHVDRICELRMYHVSRRQSETIFAAMQQPYPALTHLTLLSKDETAFIPDSFLSGSAPRLRTIYLGGIRFLGLPKLLLSATHVVTLSLKEIPYSGYILPEAMAICLSSLIRLEDLTLESQSPPSQSRPDQERRPPPPSTRPQLPVLTRFRFDGVSEYLEDLVARIDTPLLDTFKLTTTFFQLGRFAFYTSQLAEFISRTPKFKTLDEARMTFFELAVQITLLGASGGELGLNVSCIESSRWLPSLAHVCSSSFIHALAPTVEQLHIRALFIPLGHNIDNALWLEVLHSFIAVKCLYISWTLMWDIADALKMLVGERVIDVLPALQTLFLDRRGRSAFIEENIAQFVTARQLARRPLSCRFTLDM
jgi:hypothetical protein